MTKELIGPRNQFPGGIPAGTGVEPWINPLGSLRAHPWLAVAAFLLTLAAVFLVLRPKMQPKYSAQALVYVSPTFMRNLSEDKEQETQFYQYNTFIQHEVKSIP